MHWFCLYITASIAQPCQIQLKSWNIFHQDIGRKQKDDILKHSCILHSFEEKQCLLHLVKIIIELGSYPTYQVTLVWDRPILGIFLHCKLDWDIFQIQILCQTVIYLYIRYSLDIYMLSREIPIIILILIKTNAMLMSGSFTSLLLFWQTLCSSAPSCVQYISSAGRLDQTTRQLARRS